MICFAFSLLTGLAEKHLLNPHARGYDFFVRKYGIIVCAIIFGVLGTVAYDYVSNRKCVAKESYDFFTEYVEVLTEPVDGMIYDEGEYTWCEKDVEVALKRSEDADKLIIEAATITTQKTITATVFADGVELGKFTLEREKTKYTFALPDATDEMVDIKLICSDVFVPADEGIDDDRELTMKLYYIGIE